jgi:hypothetical protein
LPHDRCAEPGHDFLDTLFGGLLVTLLNPMQARCQPRGSGARETILADFAQPFAAVDKLGLDVWGRIPPAARASRHRPWSGPRSPRKPRSPRSPQSLAGIGPRCRHVG